MQAYLMPLPFDLQALVSTWHKKVRANLSLYSIIQLFAGSILDHLAYDTDFEKLVGWPLVEIRVNNAQIILSQRSLTVEVLSL